MIKNIIKTLKEKKEVSDYSIIESKEYSNQAFFVLGKLETTRVVNVTEYLVTIYNRHDSKIGSSSFVISHKLSKKELVAKINEALYASKFIFNKDYSLVEGLKKKSINDKGFEDSFDVMVEKIHSIYSNASNASAKFNAVEVFYNEKKNHIVNSKGVNLSNTVYSLNIESIPSFDGKDAKVELYRYDEYVSLDYDLIKKNAEEAIEDVKARSEAKKIEGIGECDIILRNNDTFSFFENAIADFSYRSVLSGENKNVIGDNIQSLKPKTKISISLTPSSKANSFDRDGILLSKIDIIKDGKVLNYYGSNQFGQYLGIKPSGVPDSLFVKRGNKEKEQLFGGRFLEVIALSGIQIETRANYIGGEIRLAILHENGKKTPVSGISFSGSYEDALNSALLSKETIKIKGYEGPKYIKIKNQNVM